MLKANPLNILAIAKLAKIANTVGGKGKLGLKGALSTLASEARTNAIFIDHTGNLRSSIQGEVLTPGQGKDVRVVMEDPTKAPPGHKNTATMQNNSGGLEGVFYAGMEYAKSVENKDNKDVLTGTWIKNKREIKKRLKVSLKLNPGDTL